MYYKIIHSFYTLFLKKIKLRKYTKKLLRGTY